MAVYLTVRMVVRKGDRKVVWKVALTVAQTAEMRVVRKVLLMGDLLGASKAEQLVAHWDCLLAAYWAPCWATQSAETQAVLTVVHLEHAIRGGQ